MQFEIKYLLVVLSIFLIVGGLYFKFLYDVPDGQDQTNNFVSWFLVVIGIIGIIASITMKKRINPLMTESDDDSLESDFTYDKNRSRRWKR
jgi:predicted MFS family arabinose efflux permease